MKFCLFFVFFLKGFFRKIKELKINFFVKELSFEKQKKERINSMLRRIPFFKKKKKIERKINFFYCKKQLLAFETDELKQVTK